MTAFCPAFFLCIIVMVASFLFGGTPPPFQTAMMVSWKRFSAVSSPSSRISVSRSAGSSARPTVSLFTMDRAASAVSVVEGTAPNAVHGGNTYLEGVVEDCRIEVGELGVQQGMKPLGP